MRVPPVAIQFGARKGNNSRRHFCTVPILVFKPQQATGSRTHSLRASSAATEPHPAASLWDAGKGERTGLLGIRNNSMHLKPNRHDLHWNELRRPCLAAFHQHPNTTGGLGDVLQRRMDWVPGEDITRGTVALGRYPSKDVKAIRPMKLEASSNRFLSSWQRGWRPLRTLLQMRGRREKRDR